MAFQITQSAVLYIVAMVIVVALGIMIIGQGQLFLVGEEKKLAKLFEHELIHPMEGPVEEMVEVECDITNKFNKITLKGMSFDYIGKMEHIEFIILLDVGNLVKGYYNDGLGQKDTITCTTTKTGDVYCDPPRDYYFDVSGITDSRIRDQRTSTYYHFTIWRKIPGLDKPENLALSELLERYSGYYLASFGIGGIVSGEKCHEYYCSGITDDDECDESNHKCYWHGGFLGIGSECKSCPEEDICSENTEESCNGCKFAKDNCEWSGGRCVPRGYATAEARCTECMTDGECTASACHSIIYGSFKCWLRTEDSKCIVCPLHATCDMFSKDDCLIVKNQCNMQCELSENGYRCVDM